MIRQSATVWTIPLHTTTVLLATAAPFSALIGELAWWPVMRYIAPRFWTAADAVEKVKSLAATSSASAIFHQISCVREDAPADAVFSRVQSASAEMV